MEGPVDTAFWRGHDQWENGKFAKKNNGLQIYLFHGAPKTTHKKHGDRADTETGYNML